MNAVAMQERPKPGSVQPGADAPREARLLDIDFRSLYGIVRRNWILFAAVVTLVVIAGAVVTLLTTPTYVASASVQVDQQGDRVLDTVDVEAPVTALDAERFLNTQVDILRSRSMAELVAEKLKLYSPQFLDAMNVEQPPTQPGRSGERELRERVITTLEENFTVDLPSQTRLLDLSFRSPDRVLAARVVNAYATSFIENNLERKYESSAYARDFLSRQLVAAKARLEQAERDLNQYARSAGLIDTARVAGSGSEAGAGPSNGSITVASLIQANQAANDARTQRITAEQKYRTASGSSLLNIPEVVSNPTIQTLLQRRAEANAKLEEELTRHKDGYPTVVQARSVVESVDGQIASVAETIRSSLREQYESALSQEQRLTDEVQRLSDDTLSEQDRSVQYSILAREVGTSRTLYDGLLQRFKEISASAGVTTNNISVIDMATTPMRPASPNLLVNMLLALVLGIALAVAAVLIREQLNDSIRVPEDVERKLGLPLYGSIPELEDEMSPLEALANPRSHLSEAYFAARTSLAHATEDGVPRSLLITSSQPSEGKSTTSLALATALAQLDKKVLIVDTDLRRPSLHTLFGVSNDAGLSSALAGEPVERLIVPTGTPSLSFLRSGPIPPNPTHLLGGERFRQLVAGLERDYDVVVFDGPPVMGLADSPIVSSSVAATLFVIEANRGHQGRAKTAIRRLHFARANLIGAILTKFDPRSSGASSYYGYEYYRYGDADA